MREVTVALGASFCAAVNQSSSDADGLRGLVDFSADSADWGPPPYWSNSQDLNEDGIDRADPGGSDYLFVFQCL